MEGRTGPARNCSKARSAARRSTPGLYAQPVKRLIDLSHPIVDGMTTYPGLPGPKISDYLTREDSRDHYEPGTEFNIGRIDMVANTGTYLDTPFHRFPDGFDLADLPLDRVADLPACVCRCRDRRSDPRHWTDWTSQAEPSSSPPAGTVTGGASNTETHRIRSSPNRRPSFLSRVVPPSLGSTQ